jgi:hypothetical protein
MNAMLVSEQASQKQATLKKKKKRQGISLSLSSLTSPTPGTVASTTHSAPPKVPKATGHTRK